MCGSATRSTMTSLCHLFIDITIPQMSKPWNLDSFSVYPEFSLPLGAPAGPAVKVTAPTRVAPYTLLPNQNLIFNLPPSPPWGPEPIPGKLAYLGSILNASACLALVQANASLTAMTWVGADDKEWSNTCWGRLDMVDWSSCIDGEINAVPCNAAAETVCVSAIASPLIRNETTWTRTFESMTVTWFVTNGSAYLTPL